MGCTFYSHFDIQQKNRIVAYNYDFLIDDCLIMTNNRDHEKISLGTKEQEILEWKSKYGSLTFCQFGREFPICGINEEGLFIAQISMESSIEFNNDSNAKSLNDLQWIQYHLDNSKSIKDIVESISSLNVTSFPFPLKFVVSDQWNDPVIISGFQETTGSASGARCLVKALSCLLAFAPILNRDSIKLPPKAVVLD